MIHLAKFKTRIAGYALLLASGWILLPMAMGQSPATAGIPAGAAAATPPTPPPAAEMVENPAYAAWAKFKPGTTLTIQQTMEGPGVPADYKRVVVQKLVAVKDDHIELEVKTSGTIAGQQQSSSGGGTIAARVTRGKEYLPLNTPPERVEVKDMKEGKERIQVKDAPIEAIMREFTLVSAPRPGAKIEAAVKIWSSPDVPGGMLKEETNSTMPPAGKVKVTSLVTDYEIAK